MRIIRKDGIIAEPKDVFIYPYELLKIIFGDSKKSAKKKKSKRTPMKFNWWVPFGMLLFVLFLLLLGVVA